MAKKKVTGRLAAGMLANFEESVRHFVLNDQGFLLANQIKGAQGEVLAMVKQLRCPTFLLALFVLILDGMSL